MLILRSCRPDAFAAAVRAVRLRHPGAVITALSHRGHHDMRHSTGVDRVIDVAGSRFGLLRIRPWTVARLRARRFDVVVIPQMTAELEEHANLYRMVAAIGASRVVVLPGAEPPLMFDRAAFRHFAFWSSCIGKWDVPVLLAMLAAACLRRRPPVEHARGRRLRVLHVISHLGVGGAQVQLLELLNRTPADQYEVDLLVLGASDGAFTRELLRRDDVAVSYLSEWPRLPHAAREVMIRCQARGYDVVHAWLFLANVVGVVGARLAGVPLVIASVRNLSVWKRERWYRKWWHRTADVLGSHAADVVTVNAQALVDDHARWACMGTRRIEVVHNGLDPLRLVFDRGEGRAALLQATGAPAHSIFVGTVGRLAHEKDHASFLRTLALVRRVRREVHGIVIGDGERRTALEAHAHTLGLAGAVTFLGERRDARALTAGFDLFLLTSRSEGFPNVLLEATFMGVPCVATDIAGNPDVLAREESLFPAGDVERGAERVLEALGDMPRTRLRTSEVQRRATELFTAERSVRSWLDLYGRHLEARTRPAAQQPHADAVRVSGTR